MNHLIVRDPEKAKKYPRKRYCFLDLKEYLDLPHPGGKVLALYGLRRTGKTVLMEQAALYAKERGLSTSFLQCERNVTMSNIYTHLENEKNTDVIFIDEITNAEDFQAEAALLTDKYAAEGKKLVITGTDSLSLAFAAGNSLYDRVKMVHTSYIPYEEFHYLTGKPLSDYMDFGGTLHEESPYKSNQRTEEYLNTAIVENILHSLKASEGLRRYPPALTEIYSSEDIATVIQKMINTLSEHVTLTAVKREYKSSALYTTLRNMGGSYENVLDAAAANEEIRKALKIKTLSEMGTAVKDTHLRQIKQYLISLGILKVIPVFDSFKNFVQNEDLELLTQPGMVYSHATKSVRALQKEKYWIGNITASEKEAFLSRVLTRVQGVILENMVLIDTYNALPDKEYYVSKLSVPLTEKDGTVFYGEADMIIYNKKTRKVCLFEVKNSGEVNVNQGRHLQDQAFNAYVEEHFGEIGSKIILYRGETKRVGELLYVDCEQYFSILAKCAGDFENVKKNLATQEKEANHNPLKENDLSVERELF